LPQKCSLAKDLYNQIKHTQTKLIISAQNLPSALDLLKDLTTRLSLAVNFTLEMSNKTCGTFFFKININSIQLFVHCRKSAALQKMSFATGFVT
jgi:chromosomal replication initiation ATPase DnaA